MIRSARRPGPLRSRIGALLAAPLAALLLIGGSVLPAVVGPVPAPLAGLAAPAALAAEGLAVRTSATYAVEPARERIRVTVDVRATNRTPNATRDGVVTRYYYEGVNLGVQPEARSIRATQGGGPVGVRASRRDGYQLLEVDFRHDLFFGQTATLRVTFDLPAGTPRSSSDVRVGRAFATFLAWAFGDEASVRIEVPRGFTVDTSGGGVERSSGADGSIVLTAAPTDPLEWYAWVNARNDDGLTRNELDIEGGERIVVRGWPEDHAWRTEVADLLTLGVPRLVGLVGLPWPVDGALNVLEVHSPLLEGYAGFYDPANDEITISEDLDDLTIVHEASHAWFNRDLFQERWITEGLADTYAAKVLVALGQAPPRPDRVSRGDKAAFALNDWPPPTSIDDDETDARETYGYDASWTVMSRIVAAVGDDGMRAVLKAADERTIAYVGAGPAERVAGVNDWRRFLDLAEEVGGGTGIADILGEWALPTAARTSLAPRAAAREAYHALLDAGDGWAAPFAVRDPMARWAFADATARIEAATAVLDRRDETAALAAAHGLEPPTGLEAAYEGASSAADLVAAGSLVGAQQAALEQVVEAEAAVAAPRDWLVNLGLDGEDPDGDLAAARSAWERGDLTAATAGAGGAEAALAAAPELGRSKATTIGAGIAATLVLLVVVALVVRRVRRRRRAAAIAAAAWSRPVSASSAAPVSPAAPWSPFAAPPPDATSVPFAPPPPDEAPIAPFPERGDPYATLPPNVPGDPGAPDHGPEPRPDDKGADGS